MALAILHVRGVPEALYERLKERAAAQRRSLSAEVITLLEWAVVARDHQPEATLEAIRLRRAFSPAEAGDCVVDASIGIKLFLREPLSDATHILFTYLAEDPPARLFVPDLFFVECTNILWKYARRFGYPAANAKQAIAAPRTDLDELLHRPEITRSGVYFLTGRDPHNDARVAYIGEAEDIGKRLKQHTAKEFWIQAMVFVSKDEALTRAHIQYLESKLIAEALQIGRWQLDNSQSSGAKLPESDQADMKVSLSRMRRLLPVLGLDLLTPITSVKIPSVVQPVAEPEPVLHHSIKGLTATGTRTPNGFVVFAGAQAVLKEQGSAHYVPFIMDLRHQLRADGILVEEAGHLRLTKDVEFTSPSTAAGVLRGGSANGLTLWRDDTGRTLKEIEAMETG